MDFTTFSEEKLAAYRAILKEHNLDNRRHDIATLFAMSVGRAFWNYWKEFDAKDPEWITDGHNRTFRTDGWPEMGGSQSDIRCRKWKYRAELFTSWHYDTTNHIIDWLIAAANEPAAWIANVDEHGRPKKLMKCGSLERLVHEADKAMRKQNASLAEQAAQLGIDDEHFVYDLGAGHTLVRMTSERALDIESARMHHCIGHGAYDRQLHSDSVQLLSIRDQDGKPQATLQVFILNGRDYLIQFSAPFNKEPSEHLRDLLAPLEYGTRDEYDEDIKQEIERHRQMIRDKLTVVGIKLA